MARWKVPESVVPTNPKTAGSIQYDKLRHAAELALVELSRPKLQHQTARTRAREILERALEALS